VSRFLGIDLGTTFLKGAVLDLDGPVLRHVRRVPFPAPVGGRPQGHCEIDPAAVLAATRQLLGELLADAPDAAGLFVSSQMHCLVFTDPAGEARSNVITWKDQRGLEAHPSGRGTYLGVLRRSITPDEFDAVGRDVRVGLPAVTLAWLADRGLIPAGTYPASLPGFVLANLGHTEPITDPTNAAAHGLFDLGRGDWHRGLIARLGLPELRWPRVVPTGSPVGTTDLDGRRLVCHAPVGDQQASLLGAGIEPGELSVNISTGSQVSLLTDDRRRGDFQVRPYPGGGWLNTIVQVPAGRSLSVLVDLLTEIGGGSGPDPWEYIAAAVEAVPDTDLRVNLAFFGGPFGDRGSVANIGEHNLTVGHLFTAAFRDMADNYAACAARLAPVGPAPGRDWRRVVFSGGLAHRFPTLRQAVLKALGAPDHRVCTSAEDTLTGLLALALAAGGRAGSVPEAAEPVAGR
jgi:sugar (pentulose or hexulose) kinase